jgi:hypothetical protein
VPDSSALIRCSAASRSACFFANSKRSRSIS